MSGWCVWIAVFGFSGFLGVAVVVWLACWVVALIGWFVVGLVVGDLCLLGSLLFICVGFLLVC